MSSAAASPWQELLNRITKFAMSYPPVMLSAGISCLFCIPIFIIMWLRGDLKPRKYTKKKKLKVSDAPTGSTDFIQRFHPKSARDYGGETDVYAWQQTDKEIVVELAVDSSTKSRDVDVKFLPTSLAVRVRGVQLINGALHRAVRPSESLWELDGEGSSKCLVITLRKGARTSGKEHWTNVMVGDPASDPWIWGPPKKDIAEDADDHIAETLGIDDPKPPRLKKQD